MLLIVAVSILSSRVTAVLIPCTSAFSRAVLGHSEKPGQQWKPLFLVNTGTGTQGATGI
jgi:hypothetical protein